MAHKKVDQLPSAGRDGPPGSSAYPPWLSRGSDGAWLVRVKAVPGSSRNAIAGILGDRLKVRTSAPPEGGKANAAICKLLADRLGAPSQKVRITRGAASPNKTLRIPDIPQERLHALIE